MCARMDNTVHVKVQIVKLHTIRVWLWSINWNCSPIGKRSWLKFTWKRTLKNSIGREYMNFIPYLRCSHKLRKGILLKASERMLALPSWLLTITKTSKNLIMSTINQHVSFGGKFHNDWKFRMPLFCFDASKRGLLRSEPSGVGAGI